MSQQKTARDLLASHASASQFGIGGVTESIAVEPTRLNQAFEALSKGEGSPGKHLLQLSCYVDSGHLVFTWFLTGGDRASTLALRSHVRVPASGEWLRMPSARTHWPSASTGEAEISELFGVEWEMSGGNVSRTEGVRLLDERLSFPMRTSGGGER